MRKYIIWLLGAAMLLCSAPTALAGEARELVVVLDAGHGGSDAGNTAAEQFEQTQLYEKDAALTVAKYTKQELERYDNVTVYLTRSEDKDMSLEERAAFAKSVNADIVISQHFNSSKEWAYGAEAWVSVLEEYKQTALAEQILKELSLAGLHTQHGVRERPSENGETWGAETGTNDTRLADYYGILRGCAKQDIPALIIEHLFLSVYMDVQFADTDEDLYALAVADATAIADYYGLTKQADPDISHANTSYIPPQILTEAPSAPTVTVRDGTTLLTEGTDYTLTYGNADKEGTASVTITGIGQYTGTKQVAYRFNSLQNYRDEAMSFVDALYLSFVPKQGIDKQALDGYLDTAHTRIAAAQTVDDLDIYISSAYYRFLQTANTVAEPYQVQYFAVGYDANGRIAGTCIADSPDEQMLKQRIPSAAKLRVFAYDTNARTLTVQ